MRLCESQRSCDEGVSAYKVFDVVTECVAVSHNGVVTKASAFVSYMYI
jgi:hypothetical protein